MHKMYLYKLIGLMYNDAARYALQNTPNIYFFARLFPWFRTLGCTTYLLIFRFFLVLYPDLA